jgi:hypothetical protein
MKEGQFRTAGERVSHVSELIASVEQGKGASLMSVARVLIVAALVSLTFVSSLSAQNGHKRRAVWANRPYRTGYNPYYTTGYRGTPATGDVQTLTQAYSTLASADHDYQGHRAKAMQAIKKAARLMGQKIGGDGKVNGKTAGGKMTEQQTLSDQQLRGVQTSLQKVRGTVAGHNSHRVVEHINTAIHELSTALSIK